MITIQIIAVGNIKESFYTDAVNEYKKRLSAFCKLEIVEAKEYKLLKENNQEIMLAKVTEGKDILKKIKGYAIPLCIDGNKYTSEKFAEHISSLASKGNSTLTFIIGGSHGLSDEVINSGKEKLSFSDFTFPHQLMRVILLEQIYRAFSIINGKNYHK